MSGKANGWTQRVLRTLTVRREFRAGETVGDVVSNFDCGLGCTCASTIVRAGPIDESFAERKSLCFNDRQSRGISEIAGSARRVEAPDGVHAFDVQAELVEIVPTPAAALDDRLPF